MINKLNTDYAEILNIYNKIEKILNEIKLYNDANKVTQENIENQNNAETQFNNAKISKDNIEFLLKEAKAKAAS